MFIIQAKAEAVVFGSFFQGTRIERSRRIRGEFNDLPFGNVCDRYFGAADHGTEGTTCCSDNAAGAYGGL
jgi:hypothetical protein